MILEELIKDGLDTVWAGKHVVCLETVDSTNIYAKKLAEEGAGNGTLVTAEKQTAGRGRRGRQWESAEGTAIAMTLLMRPRIRPENASMLTLVMGMAVTRALNELFDLRCQIKWPNDVVFNGRKICGILTEMSVGSDGIRYVVIGCGINVNMTEFPEELKERAVSLRMLTGKETAREEIIRYCMKYLETYYDIFQETEDLSQLMNEYNQMLVSTGCEVCILEPGNEYRGISEGINKEGQLLVRKEGGELVQVYAGEVSVRGVYGYV